MRHTRRAKLKNTHNSQVPKVRPLVKHLNVLSSSSSSAAAAVPLDAAPPEEEDEKRRKMEARRPAGPRDALAPVGTSAATGTGATELWMIDSGVGAAAAIADAAAAPPPALPIGAAASAGAAAPDPDREAAPALAPDATAVPAGAAPTAGASTAKVLPRGTCPPPGVATSSVAMTLVGESASPGAAAVAPPMAAAPGAWSDGDARPSDAASAAPSSGEGKTPFLFTPPRPPVRPGPSVTPAAAVPAWPPSVSIGLWPSESPIGRSPLGLPPPLPPAPPSPPASAIAGATESAAADADATAPGVLSDIAATAARRAPSVRVVLPRRRRRLSRHAHLPHLGLLCASGGAPPNRHNRHPALHTPSRSRTELCWHASFTAASTLPPSTPTLPVRPPAPPAPTPAQVLATDPPLTDVRHSGLPCVRAGRRNGGGSHRHSQRTVRRHLARPASGKTEGPPTPTRSSDEAHNERGEKQPTRGGCDWAARSFLGSASSAQAPIKEPGAQGIIRLCYPG